MWAMVSSDGVAPSRMVGASAAPQSPEVLFRHWLTRKTVVVVGLHTMFLFMMFLVTFSAVPEVTFSLTAV